MSWRSTWLLVLVTLASACGGEAKHDRAGASQWLSDYRIELEVGDEPRARGRYRLRFDYDTAAEPKREGFKFFGGREISEVEVTDVHGRPIAFAQPDDYEEQRLDWTVPPREGDERRQTVLVSFTQKLDYNYTWGRRYAAIDWAHKFKIPVERMQVSARVPGPVSNTDGFACTREGEGFRCVRERPTGSFEVAQLPVGTQDDSLPLKLLAGLYLLFLGFAGVRLRTLWGQYHEWYVPVELVRPTKLKDRKPRRIPTPLPSKPGKPKLPGKWRREFWLSQVGVVLAPLPGCALMAWYGRSELPLGWSVVCVGVLGLALATVHLGGFRTAVSCFWVYVASLWLAGLLIGVVGHPILFYLLLIGSALPIGTTVMAMSERRRKPSRPSFPDLRRPKPAAKPGKRSASAMPSRPAPKPSYAPPKRSSSSSSDFDFTSSCGGGSCGGCGG